MGRGKDGTEVRTDAESEEYICKRGGVSCSASLSFIDSRTSLDGRKCVFDHNIFRIIILIISHLKLK
jgi:hypothetical protein